MRPGLIALSALAVLLLVLSPLVAGYLTIPGPEPAKKTPAVTSTPAVSPTAKVTVARTPRMPFVTTTPVPAITTNQAGYESGTCTQQGGTKVTYGQQCTGVWLAATDTFSCCSVPPVAAGRGRGNATAMAVVTVTPFNLTVSLDDSPGTILP